MKRSEPRRWGFAFIPFSHLRLRSVPASPSGTPRWFARFLPSPLEGKVAAVWLTDEVFSPLRRNPHSPRDTSSPLRGAFHPET